MQTYCCCSQWIWSKLPNHPPVCHASTFLFNLGVYWLNLISRSVSKPYPFPREIKFPDSDVDSKRLWYEFISPETEGGCSMKHWGGVHGFWSAEIELNMIDLQIVSKSVRCQSTEKRSREVTPEWVSVYWTVHLNISLYCGQLRAEK